jgi:hypothetical protein
MYESSGHCSGLLGGSSGCSGGSGQLGGERVSRWVATAWIEAASFLTDLGTKGKKGCGSTAMCEKPTQLRWLKRIVLILIVHSYLSSTGISFTYSINEVIYSRKIFWIQLIKLSQIISNMKNSALLDKLYD